MLSDYQNQYEQAKGGIQVMENSKIMIVDDNLEFLEELQEMLSNSGYDTEIVPDSTRAFNVAHNIKPELILLDLKMVPKSGFQVADELRHSLQMKDVPIIAMTGFFTEKEHVLMMKLCGIKTFILKPFKPVNLITKIEFALGRRSEEYDDQST
ncbi:MAG: response regulator transcription factor [Candidatus Omnitrophica bacterium]|nr:response regulator transcription factor [Candidatus Omnitrophota bacterium]